MLTRRRVLLAGGGLVLVAVLWAVWNVLAVQRDLAATERAFERLRSGVATGDVDSQDRALAAFQAKAAAADDRTHGPTWWVVEHTPGYGDDARGIAVTSRALDAVGTDALPSLVQVVGRLDDVVARGRVDLAVVADLHAPVSQAATSLEQAATDLGSLDTRGYGESFRSRVDGLKKQLASAAKALTVARTATSALPDLLGADEPRDYLLVVQNNAEIRATGGLSGSWTRVHADDGRLTLGEQGSAGDFPQLESPVLPLTQGETDVYGTAIGRFFQDPGFTPDYPRAAQLFGAFWSREHPRVPLDGVVSIDPVAMSYLLEGTGPVQVATVDLRPATFVKLLLSEAYARLNRDQQNQAFELVTRAVFTAVTTDVDSPYRLLQGLQRAASEGRFLLAPFDPDDAARLEGTQVLGELSGDDGAVPHVDVGLNDATGSKMSYYLRYTGSVEATSCSQGRQRLEGSLSLEQTIPAAEAATLPIVVTGGGRYDVGIGSQRLQVRLYAPFGGSVDSVSVGGETQEVGSSSIDGRQVTTLVAELDGSGPLPITWTMTTGAGQTGNGALGLTPGIEPGNPDSTFRSAC